VARSHGSSDTFNRAFEWTTNKYLAGVGMLIRRSVVALLILGAFWISAGWLFKKLPKGFCRMKIKAPYLYLCTCPTAPPSTALRGFGES